MRVGGHDRSWARWHDWMAAIWQWAYDESSAWTRFADVAWHVCGQTHPTQGNPNPSRTNVYINTRGKALNVALVEQSARWMLRMFGLGEGENMDLGWGQESTIDGNTADREEILLPYLRVLSSFRDDVRRLVIAKGDNPLKETLKLCDRLRDEDLVPLGVALDDQEDGQALIKLVPPSELIKARDEKQQKFEAQAARKAALSQTAEAKCLARLEQGCTPPTELFKPPNVPGGTYSQWDERGIPAADGEGGKLSKKAVETVD